MAVLRRLALVALVGAFSPWSASAEETRPVVVELFTSQGCNSCPPADAYLGELTRRPNLLTLAFHVDYWNYIGWVDPLRAAMGDGTPTRLPKEPEPALRLYAADGG